MNISDAIPKSFRGNVLVSKAGKPILQRSCGFADLANQIPNQFNTRFATASGSKAFVATAIMMLMEAGSLHFDTTISELLDFDLKMIDRNITVRQLLNHTSGIPDYFDESILRDYSDLWKNFPNYKIRKSVDLIPLFIDKPMLYEPGARFQYNNTGYAVLGMILEAVTKKPFDLFLDEQIFSVCGMVDTGYFELDRLPERCANSYIWDKSRKEYYTNIYSVDAKGTGAGGAFTTVGDVERFWRTLYAGKLASGQWLADMLRCQTEERDCYGYGFWLEKRQNKCIPYMQGSDPGVSFISSYDAETGICITVVSNFEDNVWEIRRNIITILEENT